MIRKLVQKIVQKGYLSGQMEEEIRQMFEAGCNLEDIDALIDLQYAVMSGQVKRESISPKNHWLAS
ncbi:hypothetical protein [[Phormidium] sp. ETS-05]|uniref:hypothetical protein n=1 Tax=[Phormidium] sp. ETS-05 TaxID=222819 RepID=UPI0018EEFE17|nr:hypothetical protein [[Phormidium] sp. ETS-05]